MRKALWTLLLLLGPQAIKGLRSDPGGHMELTRLKMSLMYVRSIQTFRLLFMSFLSMGVCLILLLAGLILFYTSLFLYAPWSMGIKMSIGFLSSAVYLSVSFVLFSKIFASEKWLEIFHAESIMADINQASPVQKENEEPAHL